MLTTSSATRLGIFKALGSLLPARRNRAARGRVVTPWRDDAFRTYPSVGLTPTRLAALLQSADAGTPRALFELFDDMLRKWPRLAAVEATRRLALTGLEWEIQPHVTPDASPKEADAARRAADFCRRVLGEIDGFGGVLGHLASAIGYGVAVAELVWERGRLVDVVPAPHARLCASADSPWLVRVRTEREPTHGVPIDAPRTKWIVHEPQASAGRPMAGGLLRASALLYLAQNLSFKDWLIYSQIAGMPVRVAQFDPGTPDDDKRELLRMLEALGRDAVAVVGKNVDLRFLDAARGGDARPYEPLQRFCNTEVTILWLGQHLTTDMSSTGSRAAAEVHDRVREDLLASDLQEEAATLRRDLLTPLVRANFGDGVPAPHFRRALVQAVDTRTLAETLATAVNELGLGVPKRWAHHALGIPAAGADEPVLEGRLP